MINKSIRQALFLLFMLFHAAQGFSQESGKSGKPLVIGILPDVDSIPLLVADKEGYFTKAGADVRLEKFSSPVNRDTALQAGRIDGAVSDILAALLAVNGGFDVAITSMTNGSYKLLAGPDSGIKTLQDLRGKSVAMSLNTVIEYCTDRMAMSAAIGEGEYTKTVIPQIPLRLEMLKTGKVQAATLPEPLASAAAASGSLIIDSSDRLGINPGVILFSSGSLKAKREQIESFYRAYDMAVDFLNKSEPGEIEDFLVKDGGFPQAVRGVISLPFYVRASLPVEKEFNEVRLWLEKKGLIKKGILFSQTSVQITGN